LSKPPITIFSSVFTASYRRNEGALDPIAPPLNGFYDCSWHLTLFAGLVTAKTESAGRQTPIRIVKLKISESGRKALLRPNRRQNEHTKYLRLSHAGLGGARARVIWGSSPRLLKRQLSFPVSMISQ
jgi:hypothetical protein